MPITFSTGANGSIVATIVADGKGKPSKSGKSDVVATTSGFVAVGDLRISINAIRSH